MERLIVAPVMGSVLVKQAVVAAGQTVTNHAVPTGVMKLDEGTLTPAKEPVESSAPANVVPGSNGAPDRKKGPVSPLLKNEIRYVPYDQIWPPASVIVADTVVC